MDDRKLKIIAELMEELADDMDYSPEDFKKLRGGGMKDGVTVVKMSGESPALERAEEKMGMDLDDDMEEGESPMHRAKVLGPSEYEESSYEDDGDMPMDEDEDFKQKIMRLRG